MSNVRDILTCRDRWLTQIASGLPAQSSIEFTFDACRESITQLGSQLIDLGYPVQQYVTVCSPQLDERITRIEQATGLRVPRALAEFWRVVGGVSLVDVQKYAHVDFWDERGIQGPLGYCDGVYVDVCNDEWEAYTLEDFQNYAEDENQAEFLYSISPDGYHKDDISGGPPYVVARVGDWATLEYFDWSGYRPPETAPAGPPDLVSYLRTAVLECAGFPAFLGHPGFEVLRLQLIRDLRPF